MRRLGMAALVLFLGACAGDSDETNEARRDADAPAGDAAAPDPDRDGTTTAADGAPPAEGPGPLAPRVENETCALPPPQPIGSMELEQVFPTLAFERPLWFGAAPDGSGRRFVAEQGGRILVFDADAADPAPSVFVELEVSRQGNEEGLLGLAFHPDYAENGRFFVYVSRAGARRSVISEMSADPENPRRARPIERILLEIEQPYSNHNGGDLHFGPDGMLYIGVGDGGAGGDPLGHGQNTSTLLGSMLRIDVDREDEACDTRYAIPEDNPFAAGRCAGRVERPEIWAWGLRNPWRFSFDTSTGDLWAGDVGQNALEEIDLIEGGLNYGWNPVEGDQCFVAGCDLQAFASPVVVHGRGEARSITGGFVYRGSALPELWGAYIYGDYETGNIWAWRDGESTLLMASGLRIASFGQDPDGEVYIVSFNRAQSLSRLVRREAEGGGPPIPARLSETGCFTDTASHTVAPGVVPYSVNAPLWSDGAEKWRYLALPAGGRLEYDADTAFGAPRGTVIIKTFAYGGQPHETRLLHHSERGWVGYSYRWNEEGTDAELLPGLLTETLDTPGGEVEWTYPSRSQCDNCHTEEANFLLGLSARQLNRGHDYGGETFSQLAALAGAGYVALPGQAVDLPAFPDVDDADAELSARARATLHANCAHCHTDQGPANADIDLRGHVPLSETGMCDLTPAQGDLGIADARLLAPGDPERSVLLQRMLRRGTEQMPPLATTLVDPLGTNLVGAWIQSLEACP